MRAIILITLAILTLVAAASADPQVNVTIESSDPWMVADNAATVTISLLVIDTAGPNAGNPFEGANITLSVDPAWQLKDTKLVTDKKGKAKTTLLATKVSGTATITAYVAAHKWTDFWGWVTYNETFQFGQPIDHTTPYSASVIYQSQGQVMTATPIAVLVKDKYGNPVDNRNTVETVQFDASSQGISGFLSGESYVKSLTVPVNESGYAVVQYLVDPIGVSYINILPPSPIPKRIISIEGISSGVPSSVFCSVTPYGYPYPYTTINNGQFTLAFTFLDQYGYPVQDQPVAITTNIKGEGMTLTTNKYGMVVLNYGPKDIATLYTITATATKNPNVSLSQTVEFISGAPVDALLTASPQTMASRDVMDSITSSLNVMVVDEKGNPVAGEPVYFRFTSIKYTPYNQTQAPVLEYGATSTNSPDTDIAVVTGDNGEAVATFHPGAFSTDFSVKDYSETAEGTAVVEARWLTVVRQVTLKYVNYPYLTVQLDVKPRTVRVNETVDVTVKVKGDGWALQPKPIDVMLVSDRSGSMLYDYPDRMVSLISASQTFRSKFDFKRDRMGQVSFGQKGQALPSGNKNCGNDTTSKDDATYAKTYYPGNGKTYSDNATLDLELTANDQTINTTIAGLVPNGATSMRFAIYKAINEMKSKANPKSVKALVVLSDGDYNWYGDPLARGSAGPTNPSSYSDLDTRYVKFDDLNTPDQNMATYAQGNNIKIFTIGFASGISDGGKATLMQLANDTGGLYYYAPTGDDLAGIYTTIAGMLRQDAGVNTTMNLSFGSIEVNNQTFPGNLVYRYRYIDGHSTHVNSWNQTVNPLPGYPKDYDSTADWSDQAIDFNIGTVRLNQTWQATLTFEVLMQGTINVLDDQSRINTENGGKSLRIPDVFISALPNSTSAPYASAHLTIENLTRLNEDSRTSVDLKWDLVYDGTQPIEEEVIIIPFGGGEWVRLPAKWVSKDTTSDTLSFSISNLEAGQYTIRLEAEAMDSNQAVAELGLFITDESKRPQIKLG